MPDTPSSRALFVKQILPVGGNAPSGPRHRLIERMRFWRRQAEAAEQVACAIVVEPSLPGFEAPDDRVPGLGVMLRGVLPGRTVATSDMAALGAPTQVKPPTARCQALGTAGAARFRRGIDTVSLRLHGASFVYYARSRVMSK